ncbi:hypothetical protein HII31_08951 [Pseudocercospora fuligena]|uniref:F-box domain-containing protein n=1 Tax=Pseudocercospora fuligena TaxID=685502 RepID=A0A8H6RF77_9PEZI|nr:hypothetical protein HII31_08951 [Pseudocercospora fuligena]
MREGGSHLVTALYGAAVGVAATVAYQNPQYLDQARYYLSIKPLRWICHGALQIPRLLCPPPLTAAQKVFGIVELAESIFLELEMREHFRAQQVCRQWKAVIESSKPCRKALFLEPGTANDVNVNLYWRPDMRPWVPALRKAGLTEMADMIKHGDRIMSNPLLVKKVPIHPRHLFAPTPLDRTGYNVESGIWHGIATFRPKVFLAAFSGRASCGRMFITQPPLPFMTNTIELFRRPRSSQRPHRNYVQSYRYQMYDQHGFRLVEPGFLGYGLTAGEMAVQLPEMLWSGEVIAERPDWKFCWVGPQTSEGNWK